MKRSTILGLGIWAALLAAAGLRAAPDVPETPAPINDLVAAYPFALEHSYVHYWRDEKPSFRTGYVLVLRVDPALVTPRQTAEPVLYVGRQTAERVNVGDVSGYVVAIVPAVTDPNDPEYLDLAKAPIWFGTPELPERVNAKRIEAERRAADAAGIVPPTRAKVEAALTRGGAARALPGKSHLVRETMAQVMEFSPQEKSLVDSILVPHAR